MDEESMKALEVSLSGGSNKRVDLLNVIQKHIAQSMEADREAQEAFQVKLEELARSKELNNKLQNELTKIHKKVNEMEELQKSALNEQSRKFDIERKSMGFKVDLAESKLSSIEERNKRSNEEISRLTKENGALYSSLQNAKTGFIEERKSIDERIFSQIKEIEYLKSNLVSSNNELETLKASSAESAQHSWQLTDQIKNLKVSNSKFESAIIKLQNQLDDSAETLRQCQLAKDTLKQNFNKSMDQLDETTHKNSRLEAEILQLKEKTAADVSSKVRSLQTEVHELNAALEKKSSLAAKLAENEYKLEVKNKQLQTLVEELEDVAAASADRVKQIQNKIKNETNENIEKSKDTINLLQNRLRQMEDALQGMHSSLTKKEDEAKSALEAKEEVMAVTRGLQAQRDSLQDNNERMQDLLAESHEKLKDAESRIKVFQQAGSAISSQVEKQMVEINRLSASLNDRELELQSLKVEYSKAVNARDTALLAAGSLEMNAQELEAALNQATESEMRQGRTAGIARSQINHLMEEVEVNRKRLEDSEANYKGLLDEMKAATASASTAQESLRKLEESIEPLQRDSKRLADAMTKLKSCEATERANNIEKSRALIEAKEAIQEKDEVSKELQHLKNLLNTCKEEHSTALKKMGDENAELLTSLTKFKAASSTADGDQKKLISELNKFKNALRDQEERLRVAEETAKDVGPMTRRITDLLQQNEELDIALREEQNSGDQLRDEIAILKSEAASNERNTAILKSSMESQGRELRALVSKLKDMEHTMHENQSAFKKENEEFKKSSESSINSLKETLEISKKEIESLTTELGVTIKEKTRISSELSLKLQDLEESKRSITFLTLNHTSSKSIDGHNELSFDKKVISEYEKTIVNHKNKIDEHEIKSAGMQKENNILKEQLVTNEKNIKELTESHQTLQQQCQTLEAILRSTQTEREEINRSLDEITELKDREINRLRRRNEVLSQAVESLAAGSGKNPTAFLSINRGDHSDTENNLGDTNTIRRSQSDHNIIKPNLLHGFDEAPADVTNLLQNWNTHLQEASATINAATGSFLCTPPGNVKRTNVNHDVYIKSKVGVYNENKSTDAWKHENNSDRIVAVEDVGLSQAQMRITDALNKRKNGALRNFNKEGGGDAELNSWTKREDYYNEMKKYSNDTISFKQEENKNIIQNDNPPERPYSLPAITKGNGQCLEKKSGNVVGVGPRASSADTMKNKTREKKTLIKKVKGDNNKNRPQSSPNS